MIDFAKITVRAGDGGAGSGSFTHIRGKRYGKADGGDGGRGSHVYLEASTSLATLEPFRYVKEYRAKNGTNGDSRRRKGAQGMDLVIRVPVGTAVRVEDAGPVPTFLPTFAKASAGRPVSDRRAAVLLEAKRSGVGSLSSRATRFALDLVESGQKVLVALGGQGGRGNCHLRDEFGRRPKVGEDGQKGEIVNLKLELKLIADVGLIGLPNSGKSTLLSAITAAHPKIAPYPFTTLEPNLGVMRLKVNSSQFTEKNKETVNREPETMQLPASLVLADIPGLIEGASKGKGLGDLFLRHIERTKILVHLIDISTETDKWSDYQTIRTELKAYSKELGQKKEIIVLTKKDLVDKVTLAKIIRQFSAKRKKVWMISAVTGEGLEKLQRTIVEVFVKLKKSRLLR